jgi:GT2 family glycosyltransferase
LLETYRSCPDAIGAGGLDLQNNNYFRKEPGAKYNRFKYYKIDGWVAAEPLRYKARKLFGLLPSLQPGLIPDFSHGRSVLPPNGKVYKVEHFMGGIASYKREIFDHIKFSTFFDGYSLYEDFDFCVRALNYGKLYVNTNAKVWHYHEQSADLIFSNMVRWSFATVGTYGTSVFLIPP